MRSMHTTLFQRFRTFVVIVVMMVSTFLSSTQHANAGLLTGASDTLSRLRINQNADHSVVFTLPAGVNWDSTGGNDDFVIDFPEAATDFAQSGVWQTTDFTANDGGALTVSAVNSSAGSLTYPSCGSGVVVAIDTTNLRFGFRRCSGASAGGAIVTLGILGASGGTGMLANGTSIGSKTISTTMTDEGVSGAHTAIIAVSLLTDDSATIVASIGPVLTFDIDTATSHIEVSGSPTPYSVTMGTLTPGIVKSSDNNTVNSIFLDINTNASAGAAVTVQGTNGGLKSTAVNYTITTAYGGSPINLATQAEGFGMCVKNATATIGTITTTAPYNGTCNSTTHNIGGVDATSPRTIVTTTNAPAVGGDVEIMIKAKSQIITPAANDYTENLSFVATGTF